MDVVAAATSVADLLAGFRGAVDGDILLTDIFA
jgi:hypothetical protein